MNTPDQIPILIFHILERNISKNAFDISFVEKFGPLPALLMRICTVPKAFTAVSTILSPSTTEL